MPALPIAPMDQVGPGGKISSCRPFLVQTARGVLIKRLACTKKLSICPCFLDALEAARDFTDANARVSVVLRESDGAVMARTGPKRSGEG